MTGGGKHQPTGSKRGELLPALTLFFRLLSPVSSRAETAVENLFFVDHFFRVFPDILIERSGIYT